MRDALVAELDEQGKTEFAAEEFQAVLEREPKPAREEPWRRLSGLHTVRGRRALAVARELWNAREDYAREQDVAPGRLVPDRALVAAVLADPKSKQELAAREGLHRPGQPVAARPLVGGDRGRDGRARSCRSIARPAATRCRRRARGPTATPRPTRG